MFYVAPLLLVGAVGYLVAGRWPLPSLALAGVAVALLLIQSPYPPSGTFPAFSSPVRFTWFALDFRAGQIGSIFGFDDLGPAPVLAAATVTALRRPHRHPPQRPAAHRPPGDRSRTVRVEHRPHSLRVPEGPVLSTSTSPRARSGTGRSPSATGSTPSCPAMRPSRSCRPRSTRAETPPSRSRTSTDQAVWWEAEFWNKVVRRNYSHVGTASYTPFRRRGDGAGRAHPGAYIPRERDRTYLVWAPSNVRSVSRDVVASYPDLVLYRPRSPVPGGLGDQRERRWNDDLRPLRADRVRPPTRRCPPSPD